MEYTYISIYSMAYMFNFILLCNLQFGNHIITIFETTNFNLL